MVDLLAKARAAVTSKPSALPKLVATATPDRSYTPADLEEMACILRELAMLEDWPQAELEDKLDQLRRMAPARVYAVLEALREARRAWMASWPEAPQTRPEIVLCRLKRPELVAVPGGKP